MSPAEIDEGTPVSVKIRERIKAARKRFNANDNIAEFIEPGDLEKMLDEVTDKMQGVLTAWSSTPTTTTTPGHRAPSGQDVCQRGVQRPLRQGSRASPSFPMPST
jgi:hypothetical protein